MAGCFGSDPYDRHIEAELHKYLCSLEEDDEAGVPEDLYNYDDEIEEE